MELNKFKVPAERPKARRVRKVNGEILLMPTYADRVVEAPGAGRSAKELAIHMWLT